MTMMIHLLHLLDLISFGQKTFADDLDILLKSLMSSRRRMTKVSMHSIYAITFRYTAFIDESLGATPVITDSFRKI